MVGEATVGALRSALARDAARRGTGVKQALREGSSALRLRASEELVCTNMMCDRVGSSCLCMLSMVLERLGGNLRHLDLRNNDLERLPEVWRLPRLETLDVGENRLAALPDELATMPHLRELRADANPLREPLPEALEDIVVLEPPPD